MKTNDTAQYAVGERVAWHYGWGDAIGVIREKYTHTVTKQMLGFDLTKEATPENPAYLIEQEDGRWTIRSGSEIKQA